MEWVVWESSAAGNACVLDGIENLDSTRALREGVPCGKTFPSYVQFRMDKKFKKDTALTDDIDNKNRVKVCSPKLVEFLQKRRIRLVEYLPVRILDHKEKVAASDYRIVHPIAPQPVLDLKASGPEYSNIRKHVILDVKRLVIRADDVAKDVRIFRIKDFVYPVLIDRELADEIVSEGFVGPSFTELDEYES